MKRKEARHERWQSAIAEARAALNLLDMALDTLVQVQSEYEDWLDRLPEALQNSPTDDKLREVQDLDVEEHVETVRELQQWLADALQVDLPRGPRYDGQCARPSHLGRLVPERTRPCQ